MEKGTFFEAQYLVLILYHYFSDVLDKAHTRKIPNHLDYDYLMDSLHVMVPHMVQCSLFLIEFEVF